MSARRRSQSIEGTYDEGESSDYASDYDSDYEDGNAPARDRSGGERLESERSRSPYLSTCSPYLASRLGFDDAPLDAAALLDHVFDVLPITIRMGDIEWPVESYEDKVEIFEKRYGRPTVELLCDILSRHYKAHPEDLGVDLTSALAPELGRIIFSNIPTSKPRIAQVSRRWADISEDIPGARQAIEEKLRASPEFRKAVIEKMDRYIVEILNRFSTSLAFAEGTLVGYREGSRKDFSRDAIWTIEDSVERGSKHYNEAGFLNKLNETVLRPGNHGLTLVPQRGEEITYQDLLEFMPSRAIRVLLGDVNEQNGFTPLDEDAIDEIDADRKSVV